MTEIVVLSDSDESILSVENGKSVNNKNEKKASLDDSNFEFPEVPFYHPVDEDVNYSVNDTNNVKKSSSDFDSHKRYTSQSKKVRTSYESDDNLPTTRKNSKQHDNKRSDSSDRAKDLGEDCRNKEDKRKTKTAAKKTKSQLTEERQKRQEQLMREKALKTISLKKSKNIKPGECMKFMEVVLDKGIENFGFIADIISVLIDGNVQYSINTELIPNSVTWKRSIEKSYVNENNEICTETDIEQINQILIIWNWDEAVTKVADESFCASVSSMKALLHDYNITLVIFGIEDYFAYRKQGKSSAKNKSQKSNSRNNSEFKNFPEISKRRLETYLNEIQIVTKCTSRLINSSQELGLMIYQYTKAIAEIPFKLEKNKNLTSKFDWYVMGDNRNCVRVDKDGNGLKRLWQQQLCQFTLSSLEVAEAICSVYPSPADLIEAYMNCTHDEGINLLKDIPIRRAAGPLTVSRKIGPELSKKMYIMFTSTNGESVLN